VSVYTWNRSYRNAETSRKGKSLLFYKLKHALDYCHRISGSKFVGIMMTRWGGSLRGFDGKKRYSERLFGLFGSTAIGVGMYRHLSFEKNQQT